MGNPFVHIELNTDDLKAMKKFYRGLFDWKLEDQKMAPGSVYTMISVGKGVAGGMQKKPMPDAPTQWLPYVEVADLAKTIAKAKKLGAAVILENQEVMGMGTMGIFIDPRGAMLGLWQPAPRRPARKPAAKAKPKKPGATRR
jgi:predicted enzyme related to lactoylglutathione lyase